MTDQAYDYETFLTGSEFAATISVVVASGQDIDARTPLGQVISTGEFKSFDPSASDGTETAVYVTAYAVNTSSGKGAASVYKTGTFNPELINWPAGVSDVNKLTIFVGTPISLQLPA